MATNINLSYPNFTLTPQAGTFGTINTTEATTRLRIKNTSGGLINDFTLSANILGELIAVEYCGPLNLTGIIDGVTFFTIERVSSTQCLVKRWETDVRFSLLNLKKETLHYTSGHYYYNIRAGAVEHYNRSFSFGQPDGRMYLDINNANQVVNGTTLFLGPSIDPDNPAATEKVTVNFVDGNRVHLNSPTRYQYAVGDSITFFNNVYLISELGFDGDPRYGTIFKLDAYSGAKLETRTGGEYARITGARWSTEVGGIACISNSQLLFVKPYDSYLQWKSMFLNNIFSNNKTTFEIYDVVFDQLSIYKLAKYATTKDDDGLKETEGWSTYNYQQDTLLPYTHNVSVYMYQQYMLAADISRIYVRTKDQFGISLRDVNINMYRDGSDLGALFDPLNGQAVTDSDGNADIGYTPGPGNPGYTGPAYVNVRADKSSSYTGSQYCWNSIFIDSKYEIFTDIGGGVSPFTGVGAGAGVTQDKLHSEGLYAWQIYDPFKTSHLERVGGDIETTVPLAYIICQTNFGSPGGWWVNGGHSSSVSTCWPWFQTTPAKTDGPRSNTPNMGCEWSCITWPPNPGETAIPICDGQYSPRVNFITQVLEFTQEGVPPKYYRDQVGNLDADDIKPLILPQPLWFLQYDKDMICETGCDLEDGMPVPHRLVLLDSEYTLGFSQLNLSKHSHWINGVHSLLLKTDVNLDQFIFVEDAVPSFWSEKNARETDIWIRMRPFAFSLNGDTLKFYIREVWTADDHHYDTGYYDVIQRYGWPPNNDIITLDYFLAAGNEQDPVLGIEFTFNNPDIFHHNSTVYVHIEIEDTAAEPNLIYTDYWFKVIPDFNAPYLINEDPVREEDHVALDTRLYFEIKDDGEGIDIDTLEVFLNSRTVYNAGWPANPDTVIEQVSINHYKVTIDLPFDLQYGKDYSVGVRVTDVSENRNKLRDSYRFYTRQSEAPWFTNFDPWKCRRGMPIFTDVSFVVLGAGDGVDAQTIRIQVHDKDVTDKSKITPIIYRIS